MKESSITKIIEKQNRIIENMMKPYQNIVNTHVSSLTQNINQGIINSLNSATHQFSQSVFEQVEVQSAVNKIIQANHGLLEEKVANIMPQFSSLSSQIVNNNINEQVEKLKNFVNSLSLNEEFKEVYHQVSFADIQELIEEEYLSDEFILNQEKINKLSDNNKKKITNKLQSLWTLIIILQGIFGFLDSETMKYLTRDIPIIHQIYNTIHNENLNILTNGHITKRTNVFRYSSADSSLVDFLDYGIPFEVTVFHNGWLKIKYYGQDDSVKTGWIQEDYAVWSFHNE